ncbi:sugar transferase [Marinomonas sp. PE14-40]|uniref:sugar transferase n=1 Tax=Marinomonas sp. PE14-40 TaxID=3060621 RepID=UPI003F67831D
MNNPNQDIPMNTNENYIPISVLITKRLLDISAAILGLSIGLCLLPILALLIKLDSNGPIFFSQLRVGQVTPDTSKMFSMYKFRTMRTDAEEATGAVLATKNDPRITRIGRFLRLTRLDEIPQLYNVLKGDMSLIGPRPERPDFYKKLEDAIPFFTERTWGLKPGITGLAQVNQGYDECIEDVRNKVSYDHAYALSLSSFISWLRADIDIVFKTIVVMVCGRGQ